MDDEDRGLDRENADGREGALHVERHFLVQAGLIVRLVLAVTSSV
jgi:hypothetical protein